MNNTKKLKFYGCGDALLVSMESLVKTLITVVPENQFNV